MRECDVWKNITDVDFENAMEGMEKLVMNRLYELLVNLLVAAKPLKLTVLKHLHTAVSSCKSSPPNNHG
jgi:hypothetical protein